VHRISLLCRFSLFIDSRSQSIPMKKGVFE